MEHKKQSAVSEVDKNYLKEFLPDLTWNDMDDDDYETVKDYYQDLNTLVNDDLLKEVETQEVNFRERLMKVAYDSFKEYLEYNQKSIKSREEKIEKNVNAIVLKIMQDAKRFTDIMLKVGVPICFVLSVLDENIAKILIIVFFGRTLSEHLSLKFSMYWGRKKVNNVKGKSDEYLKKMNAIISFDKSLFRYLFNKIFIRELDKLGIPKNEQEELFEEVMGNFQKAGKDLEVK